jgi:hypothetical protein
VDRTTLSIIAPIGVAIGGGLTFVAYKHPKEYMPLALCLTILLAILTVGGCIWNISNVTASGAIVTSEFLKLGMGKIDEMQAAIAVYSLSGWWLIWVMLIWLYIWFLLSFPLWLLEAAPQTQQSPRHKVEKNADDGTGEE